MKKKAPKVFKKLGIFTDIHFGRKNNSKIHNQDCIDFVEWFCQQVQADSNYSHICFLGDWFESRSAINIETLDYSYRALKRIDSVGLPVYFVVGNHDLHRRTTRDVHSVRMFNELSNFKVIDSVHIEDQMLFSPYLFEAEYNELTKYNDLWAWAGHFEFKNFVITGYNTLMDHGPDHRLFSGPKKIFSGHFHKRQHQDNVHYVGNTFPMDFGDVGDNERGMCTYEVEKDNVIYKTWPDAPSYAKINLSEAMAEKWDPREKMKVKCIIDADISYQDAQELREAMISTYKLRDFILEENRELKQAVIEGAASTVTDETVKSTSIDELVVDQLKTIKDSKIKINSEMLIDIYKDLPIEITEDDE